MYIRSHSRAIRIAAGVVIATSAVVGGVAASSSVPTMAPSPSASSLFGPSSSLSGHIKATRIGILNAFKHPLGHGTGSVTIAAMRYRAPLKEVLAPGTVPPDHAECRAELRRYQDGTALPLLCGSGAVNIEAWKFYAPLRIPILAYGRGATRRQVQRYFCSLVVPNHSGVTFPEVEDSFTLAAAYYGWRFTPPPLATASHRDCPALP